MKKINFARSFQCDLKNAHNLRILAMKRTLLEQANKMTFRFLLLGPSFTKNGALKKLRIFFQQYMHPMYSILYTTNLG